MWGASNPAWCYSEAGVGVRGKVRGGSSQKGTFTKHSGIGKTLQAAGRVWTKEERGKRVLFLGCMVHWGTPTTTSLPPSLDKVQTDKDLVQGHSLCLHSQPPLTRAISSKGLSRAGSGGTCERSPRTHRPHQQLPGSSPERSPCLSSLILPGEATEETFKGVFVNKQGQACLSPSSLLQRDNGSSVLVGSAGQPPIVWGESGGREPGFQPQLHNLDHVPSAGFHF